MAKTDVTFIFDIVDKNIRNNPKGLVDKENAFSKGRSLSSMGVTGQNTNN